MEFNNKYSENIDMSVKFIIAKSTGIENFNTLNTIYEKLIKPGIENLVEKNHMEFIKSLIALETGIESEKVLDTAYDEYIDNSDFSLINERFYNYGIDTSFEKFKLINGIENNKNLVNVVGNYG